MEAVDVGAETRRPNARGVRNREMILDRAYELLVEEGFGAVTLLGIAGASGMSRPGLLRHFASTEQVLAALMERLASEDRAWLEREHIDLGDADDLVRLASINESRPGFVRLFAGLAGPATSLAHPAHAFFAERYCSVRASMAEVVRRTAGGAPEKGIAAEAARLTAGWDGLQLLSCYDPEVSVADELRTCFDALAGIPTTHRTAPSPAADDHQHPFADGDGYPVGRRRREAILDRAAAHFARNGYHASSLAEIARDLGVAKATLLHHFPSKEAILLAVLSRRDSSLMEVTAGSSKTATEELAALGLAARDAESDGRLPSLYVVLSGEASSPSHPAHEFFRQRFARVRRHLEGLLERARQEGGLPADTDVAHEALWLLAVWDGLQIQSLYEPEAVDVGLIVDAHILQLVDRFGSAAALRH